MQTVNNLNSFKDADDEVAVEGAHAESGPLFGVRVVDFTHILAGPFCTQLLADAGATVIKVEPPNGEWARQRGPQRTGTDGNKISSYFAAVNRGKRDVTLDLKNHAGLEVARSLIESADVVVENFSPGTMEKLGLGLEELRRVQPRLITASISLFGGYESAGELAGRGGLAIVAEAESSLMSQHRDKDGLPINTPYGLGDMASGLAAYGAIVSALFERERTGRGRHLDIAMIRVLLAFNAIKITGEEITIEGQPLIGGGRTAGMGIFRASNGYVTIGVNSDSLFHRLATAMGQPELAENPLYAHYASRDLRVEEVDEIVTKWTSSHTIEEVVAALAPTGVPCGRVNTPADILKNETSEQLSLLETVDDGIGGVIRSPANPFGFRYAESSLPSAGQYNQQIVEDLFGTDGKDFERLQREGAFGDQMREVEI